MITFKEYTMWKLDEADAAPPPAGGAGAAPPPDAGGAAPPMGGDLGGAPGGAPPDMGGAGADMGLGGSLGPGGEAGGAPANTKLLASDVYDALESYFKLLDKNKEELQNQQPAGTMS